MSSHHRPTIRLGSRATGEWRTASGERAPVSGVLVSASHGFVSIYTDAPVEFAPGDVRTVVSFDKHDAPHWRTVADGPALDWDDVSGSFHAQSLTRDGLAKCGLEKRNR